MMTARQVVEAHRMHSESSLSLDLIDAFLETDYHVYGQPTFILKIGMPSHALEQLYQLHKQECAAFLTAWNPYSQSFTEAENSVLQKKLLRELTKRSLLVIPGVGKHQHGTWAGEDSFLILGISREDACVLGQDFQQNALVWCGSDTIPQLVLLR